MFPVVPRLCRSPHTDHPTIGVVEADHVGEIARLDRLCSDHRGTIPSHLLTPMTHLQALLKKTGQSQSGPRAQVIVLPAPN